MGVIFYYSASIENLQRTHHIRTVITLPPPSVCVCVDWICISNMKTTFPWYLALLLQLVAIYRVATETCKHALFKQTWEMESDGEGLWLASSHVAVTSQDFFAFFDVADFFLCPQWNKIVSLLRQFYLPCITTCKHVLCDMYCRKCSPNYTRHILVMSNN